VVFGASSGVAESLNAKDFHSIRGELGDGMSRIKRRHGRQREEPILRTSVITAAAALIGAAVSASAGDPGDPNAECEGPSTPEIVDCLKAKTAYWDERMTIAYQRMLKADEEKQRDQLRVAQRLWIQYRDANCLYYGLGEGTIARIEAGECMRKMTELRALELEGKEDRN
jgi:uncharacterized protein YecT (DUF1311 family)